MLFALWTINTLMGFQVWMDLMDPLLWPQHSPILMGPSEIEMRVIVLCVIGFPVMVWMWTQNRFFFWFHRQKKAFLSDCTNNLVFLDPSRMSKWVRDCPEIVWNELIDQQFQPSVEIYVNVILGSTLIFQYLEIPLRIASHHWSVMVWKEEWAEYPRNFYNHFWTLPLGWDPNV